MLPGHAQGRVMGLRLYVDDIRSCPEGYILCRTVTEAIRLLDTQDVSMVSLDHDIQLSMPSPSGAIFIPVSSGETFEPVARFIANNPGAVTHVHFQTSNPAGGERMANIIRDRQPYIRITSAIGRSYEEAQNEELRQD
jgi:hypothetical protein